LVRAGSEDGLIVAPEPKRRKRPTLNFSKPRVEPYVSAALRREVFYVALIARINRREARISRNLSGTAGFL